MLFNKRAVEDHIADWVEDRFAILLEHLANEKPIHETELVAPQDQRFNVSGETPQARARELFEVTSAIAGFSERAFDLLALEDGEEPEVIAAHGAVSSGNCYKAYWGMTDLSSRKISFAKELITLPVNLVAAYARELARNLLNAREIKSEIDAEEAELLTDLCTVYLGFGIFKANAAFEIDHNTEGLWGRWSSRQQGFLAENTITYATALFCAIKGDGFDDAREALKPRLRSAFDRALKQIERRGDQWGLVELDRAVEDADQA